VLYPVRKSDGALETIFASTINIANYSNHNKKITQENFPQLAQLAVLSDKPNFG
jgi:hypothetical protein